jgi:Tfp pilus assembly protein PilV
LILQNYIRNIKTNKNKGLTLIESIISLLILMIIFVPLLASFSTASKVTVAARQSLYASNLAANVMETVKILGIDRVALQFYGSNADFILGEGVTDFDEDLSSGVSSSVKLDGEGHQVFDSSRKTQPYIYWMTGVQQGTGTYDVTITFGSAAYTSAATPTPGLTPGPIPTPELLPNDYKYADLSAFNSVSTALINPKISGTDYDYLAKAYFMDLHKSYYYDEWTAACDVVNIANDKIYSEYEKACDAAIAAGNPTPTMLPVAALPTQKPYLNDTTLNKKITRTTTIEISKVTDNLGGNPKYNLNSYVSYTLNNIEGVCANPTNNSELTRSYIGFCDNVKNTSLDSVFLMYSPFVSETDFTQVKVKIVNQTSDDFDIYLVLQAPVGTAFPSDLPVETSGLADTLRLHSQAGLSVSGIGAAISNSAGASDRLLTELNPEQARIYDVTIHVYESGSSFTKLLDTLTSTVVSE